MRTRTELLIEKVLRHPYTHVVAELLNMRSSLLQNDVSKFDNKFRAPMYTRGTVDVRHGLSLPEKSIIFVGFAGAVDIKSDLDWGHLPIIASCT